MEAAFFDLDKTIIARSGPLAFGRPFLREGLIARSALLKGMYAQLMFLFLGADDQRMEKMRRVAAELTAGWEQDKVRRVVGEVLEEVISPLIYAEALELLHDHREAGRLVCIVSTSPIEIVEPLAEWLTVDKCIATTSKVVDGKYTGELEFYAYGEQKVQAIKQLAADTGVDLDRSFAYSDSMTDLPMLEAVGNPIAVNPDRELRRIAVQRGWPVQTFRNPVRLKDRLPQFRRPQGALPAGAIVAGAVAAAGLAWWLTRKNAPRRG